MATSQKELKAAYKKQRQRVTKLAARMKEKGYELPDNAIPKVPKRITHGSVRALEKLDADAMYRKATKTISQIDEFTGEITQVTISGTEARRRERSEAALKASRTRKKEVDTVGHRGSRGGTKNDKYFKNPRFDDLKTKEKRVAETEAPVAEVPETEAPQAEAPETETLEKPETETLQKPETSDSKKKWVEDDLKRLDEEQDTGYYGDSDDLWEQIHDDSTPNETISTTETEELVESIEDTSDENAEQTTPPTEMTSEDIEKANERKNADNNAKETYVTPNITDIAENKFKDLIKGVDTPGAHILDNMLNSLTTRYGEDNVYNALSELEEIDERLLERMERVIYYSELKGGGTSAAPAFTALYKTLATMLGQTEFHTAHGNITTSQAMEMANYMEVFEEVDSRYRG